MGTQKWNDLPEVNRIESRRKSTKLLSPSPIPGAVAFHAASFSVEWPGLLMIYAFNTLGKDL